MSKQDRQGVRTAAGLEQKYQFGKTFAEIMGVATDARNAVDAAYSELHNQIIDQSTSIMRDTERIVMEATETKVEQTEFEEYKSDTKAQFQVMADEISASVEQTTELLGEMNERIDGIDGLFFYIMYSQYADGHVMTTEPDENTLYMGTCSTNKAIAPVDHTEYTWTRVKGKDAILLMIDSSAGNLFKNSAIATTLTVTIIVGDTTITDSTKMKEVFGDAAKLQWQRMNMGETEFTDIDENDPRLSDNGFIFTLAASDVATKAVFNCLLDY